MKFKHFLKLCFETVAPDSRYANNWHIQAISDRLEAAMAGRIKRLIINIPPRSMKSICVSVAWPAWILGLNPKSRIIAASYSQILSERLSNDTRYILQSPWYKELFPEVVISKSQKSRVQTTQLGYRFATSVGGSITGEGGNFLIVDDPMNPLQSESRVYRQRVCDWFSHSLLTRLNDRKNGVVVVVMHRLHVEDLTGYLLSKSHGKKWHLLALPLIATRKSRVYSISSPNLLKRDGRRRILYTRANGEPLRKSMSPRYIEDLKKDMGAYIFSAQYQQNPIDNSGRGIIHRRWFGRYDGKHNMANEEYVIVQSWDTACKKNRNSDFSVCTIWACRQGNFFLAEVRRVKLEYSALRLLVLQLEALWKPSAILIEGKSSGLQLSQELGQRLPIISVAPTHEKITRVYRVAPLIESGHVFLPHEALWLDDFEREVCAFPYILHDDQVDSTTQFLLWARDAIIMREESELTPQVRAL
ncbi:MAG: phage terminase large subunit [Anaplasma sp.]